ncbi:hypothetical protein D9M69_620270 [compost metagenome]
MLQGVCRAHALCQQLVDLTAQALALADLMEQGAGVGQMIECALDVLGEFGSGAHGYLLGLVKGPHGAGLVPDHCDLLYSSGCGGF